MRERSLIPDLVLCSPAERARQTWELVAPVLGATPEVRFDRRLYLASEEELLARVRAAPDGARRVLLVGHNPGLENLTGLLVASGPRRKIARLRSKFPTGALAALRFEIPRWPDIAPHSGELTLFAVPSDLDGD